MGNCFNKKIPSIKRVPANDYMNSMYARMGIKTFPPTLLNYPYTSAEFPRGWTCVNHPTNDQQATYYDTHKVPRIIVFISNESNYSKVRFLNQFDHTRIRSHDGNVNAINWFDM
jgi:hypothetical protein